MIAYAAFWIVMVATFAIRLYYEWRKDHER